MCKQLEPVCPKGQIAEVMADGTVEMIDIK